MTLQVGSSVPLRQYTGNGSQTAFAVPFEFRQNSDIVVRLNGALQALNTHYTLTGAGVTDGGTLTFNVAPANGAIVVIYGNMPTERGTEQYVSYGPLPAVALEADLDNGTMQRKQLARDVSRTLHLAPWDPTDAGPWELPLAASRASKFLRFDSNGQLELASSLGSVALSASIIGGHLNPQSSQEVSAGITPTNLQYPYGYVYRYGTNTVPGTTDMLTAFNRAVVVAAAMGVVCQLPGEDILFTAQPNAITGQVTIQGDGQFRSRIVFRPTAGNLAALRLSNGASCCERVVLRDFSIWSDDTTFTKIALDVYDLSVCYFENLFIYGTGGAGPSAGVCWSGNSNTSIGLRTQGREAVAFKGLEIVADRPIVVAANPNLANTNGSLDHWRFTDCYLIANGNPIVEVTSGLGVQVVLFDGYQAWVGGTAGFRINDTRVAPTIVSRDLTFRNVRREQGTDTNAYVFDCTFTAPVQVLKLDNVHMAAGSNGITINGFERVLLDGVVAAMGSPRTSFVTAGAQARSVVSMRACWWQSGSTFTPTGLQLILRSAFRSADNAGPSDAVYAGQVVDTRVLMELVQVVCPNTIPGLDISGVTGDRYLVIPQAAGSGVNRRAVNNANTDFEPIVDTFETLEERYRTGVGTSATAREIDTSGQTRFHRRLFPATDAGVAQTACGIFAGSGAPNNGNGQNGDFYLRSDGAAGSNNTIYHREGGAWVALTA